MAEKLITEIEVKTGTTTVTYAVYDAGAEHSTSHASTSHIHTLSGYNNNAWNNANYVGGSSYTTNNNATADFGIHSWGHWAAIWGSFKNNVAISVTAQGTLSTNLQIASVGENAKPQQNAPLFGNVYRNRYQLNTDGKIYLMSLNGTGTARTIAKNALNELFCGTYILASPPASYCKTGQPAT